MTGAWLLTNVATAVLPATLKNDVGFADRTVSVIMMVSAIICISTFLICALISQRIGRRRFYVWGGAAAAVGATGCYLALVRLDVDQLPLALVLTVAVQALTISLYGPIAAYLTERFPAAIRASGYGVGYSLALVIPAFYAVYLNGLSAVVPTETAPAVLIVIGGILVSLGAWLGPETRDVDMVTGPVRQR